MIVYIQFMQTKKKFFNKLKCTNYIMDCCLQCLELQNRYNNIIVGWKVLFAGFQVKLV